MQFNKNLHIVAVIIKLYTDFDSFFFRIGNNNKKAPPYKTQPFQLQ